MSRSHRARRRRHIGPPDPKPMESAPTPLQVSLPKSIEPRCAPQCIRCGKPDPETHVQITSRSGSASPTLALLVTLFRQLTTRPYALKAPACGACADLILRQQTLRHLTDWSQILAVILLGTALYYFVLHVRLQLIIFAVFLSIVVIRWCRRSARAPETLSIVEDGDNRCFMFANVARAAEFALINGNHEPALREQFEAARAEQDTSSIAALLARPPPPFMRVISTAGGHPLVERQLPGSPWFFAAIQFTFGAPIFVIWRDSSLDLNIASFIWISLCLFLMYAGLAVIPAATGVALEPGQIAYELTYFVRVRRYHVSCREVVAIEQVCESGESDDYFVLFAIGKDGKQVALTNSLAQEEAEWLGPILAHWAGKPFRSTPREG